MAQGGEPVIRVADLRRSYADVKAVDGVTFEVARGEVFGMLGPNGAGKTTTIEVLEGLRSPDSGTRRGARPGRPQARASRSSSASVSSSRACRCIRA